MCCFLLLLRLLLLLPAVVHVLFRTVIYGGHSEKSQLRTPNYLTNDRIIASQRRAATDAHLESGQTLNVQIYVGRLLKCCNLIRYRMMLPQVKATVPTVPFKS